MKDEKQKIVFFILHPSSLSSASIAGAFIVETFARSGIVDLEAEHATEIVHDLGSPLFGFLLMRTEDKEIMRMKVAEGIRGVISPTQSKSERLLEHHLGIAVSERRPGNRGNVEYRPRFVAEDLDELALGGVIVL